MRTDTIVKKPTSFDWTEVPVISIDNHLQEESVDISATAQICYDEQALYLRLAAKEKNIRAEYTGLLDQPCQDSCLEFFFSPIEGDSRYFNIEFNPNHCVYLGIGSGVNDLVRLIPQDDVLSPQANRTSDGWEITYQVPVSFIRRFFPVFTPESGKTIRANFYKCGDYTETPHYLCWNLITGEKISFHRPCDFGLLTFE